MGFFRYEQGYVLPVFSLGNDGFTLFPDKNEFAHVRRIERLNHQLASACQILFFLILMAPERLFD